MSDDNDKVEDTSVRASIIGALETHAEQGDEDARETVEKLDQTKRDLAELEGRSIEDTPEKKAKDKSDEKNQADAEAVSGVEAAVEGEKPTKGVAFHGNKDAQSLYDGLPKELRAKLRPTIEKYAKEIADTKSEIGRVKSKSKDVFEVEQIFEQPQIKAQFEALPAEYDPQTGKTAKPSKAFIVKSLLTMMQGMGHPDIKVREYMFAQIAHNFGIDPSKAMQPQQEDWRQQRDQQNNQQRHAPAIEQALEQVRNENQQRAQQYAQQYQAQVAYHEEKEAKPLIETWSKSKPHFAKVRTKMRSILETGYRTGAVDESDPAANLDWAYETACKQLKLAPPKLEQQQQRKPNQPTKPNDKSVRAHLKAAIEQQKAHE